MKKNMKFVCLFCCLIPIEIIQAATIIETRPSLNEAAVDLSWGQQWREGEQRDYMAYPHSVGAERHLASSPKNNNNRAKKGKGGQVVKRQNANTYNAVKLGFASIDSILDTRLSGGITLLKEINNSINQIDLKVNHSVSTYLNDMTILSTVMNYSDKTGVVTVTDSPQFKTGSNNSINFLAAANSDSSGDGGYDGENYIRMFFDFIGDIGNQIMIIVSFFASVGFFKALHYFLNHIY